MLLILSLIGCGAVTIGAIVAGIALWRAPEGWEDADGFQMKPLRAVSTPQEAEPARSMNELRRIG